MSVIMDYFELAQASSRRMRPELAHGCSMRMCPELEKKFPDFPGRQLELIMYLCLVAYNSEIDYGLCDDAWLRTKITLKEGHVDEPADCAHVFSNPENREIRRMAELFGDTAMDQSSWEQLSEGDQSWLTSPVETRCNILPRTAYRESLRRLSSLLSRGFIPITVIGQARQNGSSLKEKVDDWRINGGRCDLETQLQDLSVPSPAGRACLRIIEAVDVVFMGKLAANLSKVSWRKGTYARKEFEISDPADPDMKFKERNIVAMVLHPHIIHGVGYYEEHGKWNLLMEMLDTNLRNYAIEKTKVHGKSFFLRKDKPIFSREDTLDVLLQIASAVKHLHLKGWVHGDLKPDNIVLSSFEMLGNCRYFLAKVTDFGDAHIIKQPFLPPGGGSTKFAAPELLECRMNREKVLAYPQKFDVYSFGGVAHEVLTGYEVYPERGKNEFKKDFMSGVIKGTIKPNESEKWRNLRLEKRFPVELFDLVEQCWKLLPEDRPTFSHICTVLEKCKSVVQTWEDEEKKRAAEEEETAKKRAAVLLKFFAMVSLFAFIWISSPLPTENSAADPFKFIASILFIVTVVSYLCRVIKRVFCKLKDIVFPVKVKVS